MVSTVSEAPAALQAENGTNALSGEKSRREKLKPEPEFTAAADFDIRGQRPVPLLRSGLRDATAER